MQAWVDDLETITPELLQRMYAAGAANHCSLVLAALLASSLAAAAIAIAVDCSLLIAGMSRSCTTGTCEYPTPRCACRTPRPCSYDFNRMFVDYYENLKKKINRLILS